MEKFLRDVYCIEELHPLLNKFDDKTSLKDLCDQCFDTYEKSDNKLFKKEEGSHEHAKDQMWTLILILLLKQNLL